MAIFFFETQNMKSKSDVKAIKSQSILMRYIQFFWNYISM